MELRPLPRRFSFRARGPAAWKQLLIDWLPAVEFAVLGTTLAVNGFVLPHQTPVRLHLRGEIVLPFHFLAAFAEDHARYVIVKA